MNIEELQKAYAAQPAMSGLAGVLADHTIRSIFLKGVHASCTSLFASAFVKSNPGVYLYILDDQEEAGYFYHDMVQVNGEEDILFYPSSYRRTIKYGQKDAGKSNSGPYAPKPML